MYACTWLYILSLSESACVVCITLLTCDENLSSANLFQAYSLVVTITVTAHRIKCAQRRVQL